MDLLISGVILLHEIHYNVSKIFGGTLNLQILIRFLKEINDFWVVEDADKKNLSVEVSLGVS